MWVFHDGHCGAVDLSDRIKGEECSWSSLGMDHAIVHEYETLAIKTSKVEIMMDNSDRQSFAVEPHQEFHYCILMVKVEMAGRFIEEQDARFLGECPGDHNPLFFS